MPCLTTAPNPAEGNTKALQNGKLGNNTHQEWKFKIRGGETIGDPRVVVESLQAETPDYYLKLLTTAANLDYEELSLQYIPYYPLAIADIRARNIKGEVVETCDWDRGPVEPGTVY